MRARARCTVERERGGERRQACVCGCARARSSLPPAPPQTHPPTVGVCVAKRETRACLLACVDCRDKERERESECSSQPVHCFAFFQPPTTIALAAAFCCSPRLEVTYGQKCPFSFSLNHNCRVLPVALLGFNYSLVFFFFWVFFCRERTRSEACEESHFLAAFFLQKRRSPSLHTSLWRWALTCEL